MFKLVITSIEEFDDFLKLVKGKDLDNKQIKEITKSLTTSTEKLEDAIEHDQS